MIGNLLKNEYKVLQKLGQGNMGTVYLAEKTMIGRKYAVKQLRKDLAVNRELLARFDLEVTIMATFHHNNLLSAHDRFDEDGCTFLVMDYIPGDNLSEVIRAQRLPCLESLRVMKQVLAGMAYVHEEGYLHLDLKPSNLRIQSDGQVKIMDFGLARHLKDCLKPKREEGVYGTPDYMAPEQIEQGRLDARTDIYSMGVILFQLMAGEPPFKSAHPQELIYKALSQEPPKLKSMLGVDYARFDPIIGKAMAKEPGKRFASCEEFLEAVIQVEQTFKIRPAAQAHAIVTAKDATLRMDLKGTHKSPDANSYVRLSRAELNAMLEDGKKMARGEMPPPLPLEETVVSSGGVPEGSEDPTAILSKQEIQAMLNKGAEEIASTSNAPDKDPPTAILTGLAREFSTREASPLEPAKPKSDLWAGGSMIREKKETPEKDKTMRLPKSAMPKTSRMGMDELRKLLEGE